MRKNQAHTISELLSLLVFCSLLFIAFVPLLGACLRQQSIGVALRFCALDSASCDVASAETACTAVLHFGPCGQNCESCVRGLGQLEALGRQHGCSAPLLGERGRSSPLYMGREAKVWFAQKAC